MRARGGAQGFDGRVVSTWCLPARLVRSRCRAFCSADDSSRSPPPEYALNSLGDSSLFKPRLRAAKWDGEGETDIRNDSSTRHTVRPPQSSVEARIRAHAAGKGGAWDIGSKKGKTHVGGELGSRCAHRACAGAHHGARERSSPLCVCVLNSEKHCPPSDSRPCDSTFLSHRVGMQQPRKFKEPMSDDDEWDLVAPGPPGLGPSAQTVADDLSRPSGSGPRAPGGRAKAEESNSEGAQLDWGAPRTGGSGGRHKSTVPVGRGSTAGSGGVEEQSTSQHITPVLPARGVYPPRRGSKQGSLEESGGARDERLRIGRAVEPQGTSRGGDMGADEGAPPAVSSLPQLGARPKAPATLTSSGARIVQVDWREKGLGSPRARVGQQESQQGAGEAPAQAGPAAPAPALPVRGGTGKALPALPPGAPAGAAPGLQAGRQVAHQSHPATVTTTPPTPPPRAVLSAMGGEGNGSAQALPPPPMLSGPLLGVLRDGGERNNGFGGGEIAGKQPLPPLGPRSLSSLTTSGFRRSALTRGEQLKAIAGSPPADGDRSADVDEF